MISILTKIFGAKIVGYLLNPLVILAFVGVLVTSSGIYGYTKGKESVNISILERKIESLETQIKFQEKQRIIYEEQIRSDNERIEKLENQEEIIIEKIIKDPESQKEAIREEGTKALRKLFAQ